VIASLWWQNRKRSPEIILWFAGFVLQFAGVLLITCRVILPDFFTIIIANVFIIGGIIILCTGLSRYVGKDHRQLHNYLMLAVFTLVHLYLTYVHPDFNLRVVNLSVAFIFICAQCSWLMLREVEPDLRPVTKVTGIIFAVLCLFSIIQITISLMVHRINDLLLSGFFGIFAILIYQIAFIALSIALFLMVSRRLSMALESEILQRRQEEKLIRLRLSLLEFAATHSLEEVLQQTLDEVGTLVESPIGFYHFVESDQKTLSLQAWSTRTLREFCKAEGRGLHYGIDQAGVWVDCVHEKRAVIHNDYNSLPHRKGMPEGHAPVIRELVVPIMRGDLVVAILGIGNKPVDYTRKDAETVSYLADVAWEITRRKKTEEALKKSEEKFKQLAEVFPETIFEADIKGYVTYANDHGLKHFGFTKEDIAKGMNIFDLISPANLNTARERIQSRIQGGNKKYLEYQALKKDGSTFHALALSTPIMADGIPVGIRGFILDITESKQAEEALRESEERLHAITNSANDAIIMIDNDGNISYWNPAAEDILGYTGAEAIGRNLHELIAPDRFLLACHAAFPEFQKNGKGNAIGKTLELAARRKDGHEIDVALSLSAVNIKGMWNAVGIIKDITERKQAEEALRESEERYHFIADHTADHIWTMDLSLHFLYSSPAVFKILGYTIEELMAKPFDQFFTPESLVTAQKALMEELEADKDPNVDPNRIRTLQSEHYHKNGNLVWLESSLTFIRDAEMKPVGILGVSRDITERKKSEEQIKHFATHDLLTDLPSLRLARDRMSVAINMARRYKKAVAIMFIDLDGFKAVNDTLGHDAGDYMLRQVAQRLLSCVRETDTVARVGGDEFLIIATEINSPENAAQIAEKVIQLVSQPVTINEKQAVVGASIGIALFPDHASDMDQLIKIADEAMYEVKNAGKNGFRFVNSSLK